MVVKVCIQQNSAVSFGESLSDVVCNDVTLPFLVHPVPHVVAELLKDALQIELSYGQATNITLGYALLIFKL